jgi:hypothetical protein
VPGVGGGVGGAIVLRRPAADRQGFNFGQFVYLSAVPAVGTRAAERKPEAAFALSAGLKMPTCYFSTDRIQKFHDNAVCRFIGPEGLFFCLKFTVKQCVSHRVDDLDNC